MTEEGELDLGRLDACFRGFIPASLGTCSAQGVPNTAFVSMIQRVGDRHLALSCQFFSTSRSNIKENPFAQLLMLEPSTLQQSKRSGSFLNPLMNYL